MPVKRCTVKGKSGYKFGDRGTCYPGESGKVKAARQGLAEINRGYKAEPGTRERLLGIISHAKASGKKGGKKK